MTAQAPLWWTRGVKRTISERVTATRRAACANAWLLAVILLLPRLFPFAVIVWEQVETNKKRNGKLPGDLLLVTYTCYHGDCPLIAGGHLQVCRTEPNVHVWVDACIYISNLCSNSLSKQSGGGGGGVGGS